eukprot:3988813-Amphidinium_carterae.1
MQAAARTACWATLLWAQSHGLHPLYNLIANRLHITSCCALRTYWPTLSCRIKGNRPGKVNHGERYILQKLGVPWATTCNHVKPRIEYDLLLVLAMAGTLKTSTFLISCKREHVLHDITISLNES